MVIDGLNNRNYLLHKYKSGGGAAVLNTIE